MINADLAWHGRSLRFRGPIYAFTFQKETSA